MNMGWMAAGNYAYKTTIKNTILGREPLGRRIEIAMSYLKLGYLYSVLCIEQTKLDLFAGPS